MIVSFLLCPRTLICVAYLPVLSCCAAFAQFFFSCVCVCVCVCKFFFVCVCVWAPVTAKFVCVCVHAYAAVPLCMNGYKVFVHVHHHPRTDPLEKINNWTIVVATMKCFLLVVCRFFSFSPTKILETRATVKNEKKNLIGCVNMILCWLVVRARVSAPHVLCLYVNFFFCLYTPIGQLLIFNSCPSSPEKTSISAQLTCMVERWKMWLLQCQ